jgi:hypothetical protein
MRARCRRLASGVLPDAGRDGGTDPSHSTWVIFFRRNSREYSPSRKRV